MSKSRGHDYSTLLIWSAAVVTVVRYAAAFIASDTGEITGAASQVITWLMGLSGLGMGVLDVIGGTYLFDGWRRTMPSSGKHWSARFTVLTVFVFALMATGVMILVPFTMSRVTHTSMAVILDNEMKLTWWALLVNLAPYLLIGGVAIGNQMVQVSYGNLPKVSENFPNDDGKLSRNFPNDWRKVRKVLTTEQMNEIARLGSGDIAYKFGVSERTAVNWRRNAQKEIEK